MGERRPNLDGPPPVVKETPVNTVAVKLRNETFKVQWPRG